MSPPAPAEQRAEVEAAQWVARLNSASVSTGELEQFARWRKNPLNAEALKAAERAWELSPKLRSDPDVLRAMADAHTRVRNPRRAARRVGPVIAVGATSFAVAAAAAVVFLGSGRLETQEFATGVGERRAIVLADGSRIGLDTASRVRVRYTDRERAITLVQGQALFDVIHTPARPFRVSAGGTQIRDLGTRFDVRRDDGRVRVTVVDGSVQVSAGGAQPPVTLHSGQQVIAARTLDVPRRVDPVRETSWTTGHLIFEELPLSQAIAEMNRYGRSPIILDAGALADVKVSGAFDSTDGPAFVEAVSHLYGLSAQKEPDGSVRLFRPSAGQPA